MRNLRNHSGFQTCVNDRSVALSPAHQKQGSFPPPTLLGLHGCMTLSVFRAGHHPIDDVEGATFTIPGYPAITQITVLACCAHYPGGSNRCVCRFLLALTNLSTKESYTVESRKGAGPGPTGSRWFPFPAHRTGRAHFEHPALRQTSRKGL